MNPSKPTPKQLFLFTTDCKGDPIFEDSHLRARRWWPPHYTSSTCYLWHIERGKTGKLMLVADGCKRRVPLTEGRARELEVYPITKRFKLSDYPEEWAWWRASGWGLSASDYDFPENRERGLSSGTGLTIDADRRNSRRGYMLRDGKPDEEAIMNDPEKLRRLLRTLLFVCLHPRKAEMLSKVQWLDGAEEEAFVSEQRRKLARLGIS